MQTEQPFSISFEFFPPKTIQGKSALQEAMLVMEKADPHFYSVTFGAGGSTKQGTLETVHMLREKTSHAIAPHLTCVALSRAEILTSLMQYKELGVTRIVALRGDVPSGIGLAPSDLTYASDLVHFIREVTGDHFHIEVAAYPEFHPQAKSSLDDILNLKRKYEAGANSAITQYFFNPDAYFYYLDHCAKLAIHLPIVPGIMPISKFSNLANFSNRCGAEIPRWMRKRLEAYSDDEVSIMQLGIEIVYRLCERLISGGAPGLHFYTLNKAELTMKLLAMLNLLPERIQPTLEQPHAILQKSHSLN